MPHWRTWRWKWKNPLRRDDVPVATIVIASIPPAQSGKYIMQIELPDELEKELRLRAQIAGYQSVGEYVLKLVNTDEAGQRPLKHVALQRLRELRKSVVKMSTEEIIELIQEGRDRCPS